MQQQPDEHKRQRSTQAKIKQYGRNSRKLWNEYGPVKARVQYLCDVLFAGDYHEMALAAGLCYRQLYRILYGHSRLSIRLAGQLVSRLGVRAEWLLCGSGDVMPWPEQAEHYSYLPKINSCYYTLNTHDVTSGTYFLPAVQPDIATAVPDYVKQNYVSAARHIFAARTASKPVLFFLGAAAFTDSTSKLWAQFFSKRYATMLAVTLAAVCADLAQADEMPRPDINSLALTAAAAGAGYGETICQHGFRTAAARQRSLLASVFADGHPVFVSTQLGEVPNHVTPFVRAPELGAAIGAASYVDLLAFAEQVPNFSGTPGGVILAAGDCERAVQTFLAQFPVLRHTHTNLSGFTFVLFSDAEDLRASIFDDILHFGGNVVQLSAPTATSIQYLLRSCDDVYAGTTSS